MIFGRKSIFLASLLALACSNDEGSRPTGNKSNCILVSRVIEGKTIDEYLIDNGMDGSVDLYLRCERDNYKNSLAYMARYTFDRVREVQGNSKLAYQIKHPISGLPVEFSAELEVIDIPMQIYLDKRYQDNYRK